MFRFSCLVLLLSLSAASIAEIFQTPWAVPEHLHVYDDQGNTYVDLVVDKCNTARYWISPSHPKYDTIVSILLAAEVAKRRVSIRYNGCDASGNQGKLIGVYITND